MKKTISNHDDLDDINDDTDFVPLYRPETTAEERKRRIKYYTKIASKHGVDKIYVGGIVETWEDYINNRLNATIEYPVQDETYIGTKRVECYLDLKSPAEVAQMTMVLFHSRTLVVDRNTMQIIASRPAFF